MSSIAFIAATQPSVSVTSSQPTAQQSVATAQPQPTANAGSNVTISPSGTAYANYLQTIAEIQAGMKELQRIALGDPNSADMKQGAYNMAHETLTGAAIGGAVNISAGPNAPVTYSSGAPVTAASQAYFTQQATSYQNQALQLYSTELAKGTSPGQIVSGLIDLQSQQPAAFRAMMMWPPASDPLSIQTATNTPSTPSQYLNGGGQVVKS